MMLDRKSTTSEFLHHIFLQHQLELLPQVELSSNDLLIDMARIGLGIAFIWEVLVENSQAAGSFPACGRGRDPPACVSDKNPG